MKVTIIDDDKGPLAKLKALAERAGHEVQVIDPFSYKEVGEVCQLVRQFKPDVLVVDHNLQRPFTGQDIVRSLRFSSKRCIGISYNPSQQRPYCSRFFNKMSIGIPGEDQFGLLISASRK